jgi:cell division protease FtsH
MAWGSQGMVFLGEDLMQTRDYSDETARVIDEEVERILREQEERCRKLLSEYRNGLDLVARRLLEHETVDGTEVKRLVDMSRNGTAPATARPAPQIEPAGPAVAPVAAGDDGPTER